MAGDGSKTAAQKYNVRAIPTMMAVDRDGKILGVAAQIDANIYTVFGGLHLVDVSDQDVVRIVDNFSNKWRIQRVAAGHCAGEFARSELATSPGRVVASSKSWLVHRSVDRRAALLPVSAAIV